ncbi:MAG: T9SS type A sorting domain-containing protein [Lentimicrobium sp.]|nr:T9SS type A sorting domain-containing protein [Lentimicrobium sp.]
MKKSLPRQIIAGILLISTCSVFSQSATLVPVVSEDGAIMIKVSDNGLWAAGYYEEDVVYLGATIWNLSTYEANKLIPAGQAAGAFDVTDDGKMAVGCYNNRPAYWQNGTWTELPMPVEGGTGGVYSVTPDGTKMGGRVFSSNMATGYACVWENGVLIDVNHADVDRFGDNANFNEINGISADGNTMLGCLNYVVLPNRTAFLMKNGEYFMFGAENYDPQTGGDEYNFYDVLSLSPNGRWVTGDIYWVEEMWTNEYFCPFRYDVENDITELFLDDVEVASFASDNSGNLFGATPLNYPIREALILKNGLWVSLDQEILNEYGLNVYEETGYDKLGSVFSVSADGKTIVGTNGSRMYNWVLKLDVATGTGEAIQEANPMKAVVKGSRLLLGGKVSSISVCDLQGKIVLNEQIAGSAPIFNVSHLPAGIYVVNMTDANNNIVRMKVYIGSN